MGDDLPIIPEECVLSDGDGIVYEMGEYSAPRPCTTCGVDGDFYVFMEGFISKFLCAKHFREAPRKPSEEIDQT